MLKDAFAGKSYSFKRTIVSRNRALPSGRVDGVASFTNLLDPSDILYKEEGTFTTSDFVAIKVSRSYIWRFSDDRSLEIYFIAQFENPPKIDYLFLPLVFDDSLVAEAVHPCCDDLYEAKYDFAGLQQGEWTVEYLVKGPEKDYTLRTCYSRIY